MVCFWKSSTLDALKRSADLVLGTLILRLWACQATVVRLVGWLVGWLDGWRIGGGLTG